MTRRNVTTLRENFICLERRGGILKVSFFEHQPDWRAPMDECRFLTSPAYHLLRKWHALEELPYLGQKLA